jgi:radical SAM superfamily enzyme YgiQ (UPF0313 family)
MRVLLLSANTETLNMPTMAMGLGAVAAAARAAGHTVRFIDLMGKSDVEERIATAVADVAPDVIGVSIRNIDDQKHRDPRFLLDGAAAVMAACRRASRAPTVLGGAGYSLFPASTLDYLDADMGIQGEGEVAFPRLLDSLAHGGRDLGDVPGLYRRGAPPPQRRVFESDLDRLPIAGPDLFDPALAQNPACYLPFQTRRGCPLGCSYCSTATIEGHRIRRRSPEAVTAALKNWRQAGFKRVFFVDNTFNLPPTYAKELCRRIERAALDLQWRAILYPGQVDRELVDAMARAGCREVSLGFESGSAEILAGYGKHFGPGEIRRTVRLLRDAGIQAMGFLMLGGPGETRDTVLESLAFADSLELEAMHLTVGVRIYPYTDLARRAATEGLVDPADDLLRPRFYVAPRLADWLHETAAQWCGHRPGWCY